MDSSVTGKIKIVSKQSEEGKMKIIIAFHTGERLQYTFVPAGKNWLIDKIENISN